MTHHLILGTAGHVDHGKTALIKALTNIDCDTHKEEKERGITINLGFSHLDLPSEESLGIVDVPGHKDFIKTMVAGSFGIDIVLLVVAADSGIMPQTTEHLKIIEMLGIKNGIVAITKTDLVDDDMLELAELELVEFIEGSVLENAPIVKVSSVTGNGIDELVNKILTITSLVKKNNDTDLFRMYIDRLFNVKGIGFVVTGSVLSGVLKSGNNLLLLPGKNKKVKVRNIERHGKSAENVMSGDRAALNLSGLKQEDFQRGMVLSNKPIENTSMIDATFNLFAENAIIGIWSNVIFYSGTFECAAKLHLLDKDDLTSGNTAIVQIIFSKPAILQNKDKYIVRNSSNDLTLGGGDVIDTFPLHHKKRTPKLIESLKDLVAATLSTGSLFDLIKIEIKKENAPVLAEKIANNLNLTPEEIWNECLSNTSESIVTHLIQEKRILISKNNQDNYRTLIINALDQYHKKYPVLDEGMETKEFYGKTGFSGNEIGKLCINALVPIMETDGLIKKVGNTWALLDHTGKIDPKIQEQIELLDSMLKNEWKTVPNRKDLEIWGLTNNINKERLNLLLRYLVSIKKVYLIEGYYLQAEVVSDVRKKLLEVLSKKENGINEKEFRLLIDSSKRFVQLILQILINEGSVTKESFYIHITEKGKEHPFGKE